MFAKHLRDTRQSFGPMEHIMDILYFVKKGKVMYSLEEFYIYCKTLRNNQINKESTTGSNKIYNVVIQHKNDRC